MGAFCRIRKTDAKKVSELATARGLEHYMLEFPGDAYSDWVTFQFTNHRGKRAFENLCAENNVSLDGTQVVHRMMDAVLAGESPKKAIDEALTNGMKRAMRNGAKLHCPDCGLSVPKYKGRYPAKCPECGGALVSPKEVQDG